MTNKVVDDDKYVFVENEYDRCRNIINESIRKNNIEKALAGISIASSLLYLWNQKYTDSFLEEAVSKVSEYTITEEIKGMNGEDNAIMFYDSFGLDMRGLAYIYIKALSRLNRKIYYVVPSKAKGNQPEIDKIISGSNIKKVYLKSTKHLAKLRELQHVILMIRPSKAFLYTLPNDAAGVAVFMQMNHTTRYLVNLTDHAFWLGVHSFDYLLEFRNYGAFISHHERGIDKDKLVALPFYPIIDREARFQGFPFETAGRKIIFSGGALGKSIDKEKTYYRIVERILEENDDCIFVYAGSGDDTDLKTLMGLFPERTFHISERKDLFQVMKHITLYLNTYPIVGGLMTQYAAAAGKIPIMLWKGPEHSGILVDQESRMIEYRTPEELVNDVSRLLADDEYLHKREKLLIGSVIEECEFECELNRLIDESSTKFELQYISVDTLKFRKSYADSFAREDYWAYVAHRENISLLKEFREAYIYRFMRKARRLLNR